MSSLALRIEPTSRDLTAVGIIDALSQASAPASDVTKSKWYRDTRWTLYQQMLANPWRIVDAATDGAERIWCSDYADDDFDRLDGLLEARLAEPGLTVLDRAGVEAAQKALAVERQEQMLREWRFA